MLQALNRASLRRLLRFELERDLDEIASAQLNDQDAVFELLNTANRNRWIEELLEALKDSVPGNQMLQSAIEEIQAAYATLPPGAGGDPHTACLIGRHVLINRDDLRNHMRRFTTAQQFDPRIIVVTGPDASGKTYTRELITYLATHFDLKSPIFAELGEWPGGSCSPDDLMDSIVTQMGFDPHDMPIDDEAQGARRAIKLKNWFVGRTRDFTDEQWIVLDDLDHPGVPTQTLDLVELLALAVVKNAIPHLRMILLGYERPIRPDIGRDILFERLALMDNTAVQLHARELAAQYLDDQQMVSDEGKLIADAALQGLMPPFDRDKLITLTSQFEAAVTQFLARI